MLPRCWWQRSTFFAPEYSYGELRGILPLFDWMAEPMFMNAALIKLLRSHLDAGDVWHVTQVLRLITRLCSSSLQTRLLPPPHLSQPPLHHLEETPVLPKNRPIPLSHRSHHPQLSFRKKNLQLISRRLRLLIVQMPNTPLLGQLLLLLQQLQKQQQQQLPPQPPHLRDLPAPCMPLPSSKSKLRRLMSCLQQVRNHFLSFSHSSSSATPIPSSRT